MSDLHPAVKHLMQSGLYECRPAVEIFTEHELKDRQGKVVRKVTKQDLDEDAKVLNEKTRAGNLTLVGPGHTFDDEYDAQGKLIKKFPEEQQPKPFGAYCGYKVAWNPHTKKYSLYADEYVQKKIVDPQTGKEVDGMQYSASFPRRSAEIYHSEHYIDWVAALRRAPRLDMGIAMHARQDPDHAFYGFDQELGEFPIWESGNPLTRKARYSYALGGDEMPTPQQLADAMKAGTKTRNEHEPAPTSPPDARQEPPADDELPPEHQEAAMKYGHHYHAAHHGMHHSRVKTMLHHMHAKYGHEMGMTGDPMTPHESHHGMLSGTSVAPHAEPPASPAASSHAPMPPEHAKMQRDQEAIEKTRYERELAERDARIKALEDRNVQADASALESHMRYELMQLVAEHYPVNAAEEFDLCQKRRYSKQQFDDHVGDLRRVLVGRRAPIDDIPLVQSPTRDFRTPDGANGDWTQAQFDRYQRAIRNGQSTEEAEKYALNGSKTR